MKRIDELMLKANNPATSEEDKREALVEACRITEAAMKVLGDAIDKVIDRPASVDGDALQKAREEANHIERDGITRP